jgi:putative redox protein
MNMSLRTHAQEHAIPLQSVSTVVSLDRSEADAACFKYSVELLGDLSGGDRRFLLDKAGSCAVRQTLSKKLIFREEIAVSHLENVSDCLCK